MSTLSICRGRLSFRCDIIPSLPRASISRGHARQQYRQLAQTSSTTKTTTPPTPTMTSITDFKLDPSIFNQTFYQQILRLWFSSYPNPLPGNPKTDLMRWFGKTDPNLDSSCTSIGGSAIKSLSPSKLLLPQFSSIAEDRKNHASLLAAPFLPEFADAAKKPRPRDRADAALALVILLDQMTRNTLRDDAGQTLIYGHYDRLARAVAAAARAEGVELDRFAGDEIVPGKAAGSNEAAAGQLQAVQIRDSPIWRFWFYMPLEHSEDVADHDQFEIELDDMERMLRANNDEPGLEFIVTMRQVLQEHSEPLRRFGRYPWRNRFLGREFTTEERAYIDGGGKTFGVKA